MSAAMRAANLYQQVELNSSVDSANKHQLIQMLFDGLVSSLVAAEHHIQQTNLSAKSKSISRACQILMGLQTSLDHKNGGEIASNLGDLYDYASRRLVRANIDNDASIVAEVRSLLTQIKEAWETVPEALKTQQFSRA